MKDFRQVQREVEEDERWLDDHIMGVHRVSHPKPVWEIWPIVLGLMALGSVIWLVYMTNAELERAHSAEQIQTE